MKAVVQRVKEATVTINGSEVRIIGQGLLIFLGITHEDTNNDVKWLAEKISKLRIFSDEAGKMNLSVLDLKASILLVSQFTLYAQTHKGNRPSFIKAAPPVNAIPLYHSMIDTLNALLGKEIATGEFGADMQVSLVNDGPVTIIIDTKQEQ